MSIAVICPRCQTHFGITDDLADEPVCCPKCANVFSRGGSAGIQAGTPPSAPKTGSARNDREDDEPMPPSRPHAPPRVPFPTVPLLILVCGILFLLLALSVGFNLWVIAHPDLRIDRQQQAMRAADEAQAMRMQAEQEAKRAAENQQKAEQQEAKLKRDLDDLRRELEAVRLQLDDAKRKPEK
jgi:uncharacterized protein HemX